MSWDEEQYDAAPGHPKFTHARVTHELRGDIEGEASICYLLSYRPDHVASFVGFAMVTGKVGEQERKFRHAGRRHVRERRRQGTMDDSARARLGRAARHSRRRALRGDRRGASYLLDVTFERQRSISRA